MSDGLQGATVVVGASRRNSQNLDTNHTGDHTAFDTGRINNRSVQFSLPRSSGRMSDVRLNHPQYDLSQFVPPSDGSVIG